MQFVFQDQVTHFIGALAKLVQGVSALSQPETQNQPGTVEPIRDIPVRDEPIRDEPIGLPSIEVLLRPWLPTIEDKIAQCSLSAAPLLDFSPGDDNGIAGNGVQAGAEVRNFGDLVANFAPEATNTIEDIGDIERTLLSERGLSEEDFSHAVDEIFEPSQSIWQNN